MRYGQLHPPAYLSPRKSTRCPLYRRVAQPRSLSRDCEEDRKQLLLLGIETQFLGRSVGGPVAEETGTEMA
jgi:hypothetical protein